MRAAAWREGALQIEDRECEDPPKGSVRVGVRACGICGTDLHLAHAGLIPPGLTPGHEITGVVEAIGDQTEAPEVGTPVVVEPLLSCGKCVYCASGRSAICPEVQNVGVHVNGGFAETVTVPARRVFPISEDVPPEVAALTEPLAVVLHGMRRGNFSSGQRVLVLGAGTIGLLSVVVARHLGAKEISITARHAHQADLARELGASRVLREADTGDAELSELGRNADFDLVLETVGGNAPTLAHALQAVRPGGSISVLGLFMGSVSINGLGAFLKEITLGWSNCYSHGESGIDFEDAVQIVCDERERLRAMVTHCVPLAEIRRGYQLASDRKSGSIKVSVLPGPTE